MLTNEPFRAEIDPGIAAEHLATARSRPASSDELLGESRLARRPRPGPVARRAARPSRQLAPRKAWPGRRAAGQADIRSACATKSAFGPRALSLLQQVSLAPLPVSAAAGAPHIFATRAHRHAR